jgi:hypothetical protein
MITTPLISLSFPTAIRAFPGARVFDLAEWFEKEKEHRSAGLLWYRLSRYGDAAWKTKCARLSLRALGALDSATSETSAILELGWQNRLTILWATDTSFEEAEQIEDWILTQDASSIQDTSSFILTGTILMGCSKGPSAYTASRSRKLKGAEILCGLWAIGLAVDTMPPGPSRWMLRDFGMLGFAGHAGAGYLHLERLFSTADAMLGCGGCKLIESYEEYDHDVHHATLVTLAGVDFFTDHNQPSQISFYRYGNVKFAEKTLAKWEAAEAHAAAVGTTFVETALSMWDYLTDPCLLKRIFSLRALSWKTAAPVVEGLQEAAFQWTIHHHEMGSKFKMHPVRVV